MLSSCYRGVPLQELQHSDVVSGPTLAFFWLLNQYQGGMCISGVLKTAERTTRHLISPLGPNWVGTDIAV